MRSPVTDLLDVVFRACPELNEVDFGAKTDDGVENLVALVQLLTDEHHGKPLLAIVGVHRGILHREHPLAAVRVRLVLSHRHDARW